MKTRNINGMEFAELTERQTEYILGAQFKRHYITHLEIKQVNENLDLEGRSDDELHAIRNSVVSLLADASSEARSDEDWANFDRLNNNMMAITAVIDDKLWKKVI